jgi:hypothetical protein
MSAPGCNRVDDETDAVIDRDNRYAIEAATRFVGDGAISRATVCVREIEKTHAHWPRNLDRVAMGVREFALQMMELFVGGLCGAPGNAFFSATALSWSTTTASNGTGNSDRRVIEQDGAILRFAHASRLITRHVKCKYQLAAISHPRMNTNQMMPRMTMASPVLITSNASTDGPRSPWRASVGVSTICPCSLVAMMSSLLFCRPLDRQHRGNAWRRMNVPVQWVEGRACKCRANCLERSGDASTLPPTTVRQTQLWSMA